MWKSGNKPCTERGREGRRAPEGEKRWGLARKRKWAVSEPALAVRPEGREQEQSVLQREGVCARACTQLLRECALAERLFLPARVPCCLHRERVNSIPTLSWPTECEMMQDLPWVCSKLLTNYTGVCMLATDVEMVIICYISMSSVICQLIASNLGTPPLLSTSLSSPSSFVFPTKRLLLKECTDIYILLLSQHYRSRSSTRNPSILVNAAGS